MALRRLFLRVQSCIIPINEIPFVFYRLLTYVFYTYCLSGNTMTI